MKITTFIKKIIIFNFLLIHTLAFSHHRATIIPFDNDKNNTISELIEMELDLHECIEIANLNSSAIDKIKSFSNAQRYRQYLSSLMNTNKIKVLIRGKIYDDSFGKKTLLTVVYLPDGFAKWENEFVLEENNDNLVTVIVQEIIAFIGKNNHQNLDKDPFIDNSTSDDSIDMKSTKDSWIMSTKKQSIKSVIKAVNNKSKTYFNISLNSGINHWTYFVSSPNKDIKSFNYNSVIVPQYRGLLEYWPKNIPLGFKLVGDFYLNSEYLSEDSDIMLQPRQLDNYFIAIKSLISLRLPLNIINYNLALLLGLGHQFNYYSITKQKLDKNNQTIIPSYIYHGVVVDLGLKLFLYNKIVDISFNAGLIPLGYYDETPDSTGDRETSYGWYFDLSTSVIIYKNIIASFGISYHILSAIFEGQGSRRDLQQELFNGAKVKNNRLLVFAGLGYKY